MTRFRARRASLLIGLAATLPLSAGAQDQEEDADTLGQLVVTAQKRETELQDVPFSVAAQTEEQIRNSGATNIVEFARNVSGLTITDLGPGQSQVAVRGISAGQVIRDQPGVKEQVGVYLDESAISVALFTPDLELFDLARVEVLRGPQGTLFGAGSTAGTLRYITAQPRLGEFEGKAEFSANEGTDSDFGGAIKGAVNIPLGDSAALRIAGYYNQLAGFMDAVQPDGSVEEDVNGGDKTGARVSMLFQPNENISITPRIVYQKLDTDGFPRIDVWNILANEFTTTQPTVNLGEREQFTQLEEGIEDDFALADLKLEFGIGDLTLTSITSYTDREVIVTRDASQLTGSVTFDIGGEVPEVRLDSTLIDSTDLQALSQEFRLSGGGEQFQWLVGAFYQDVDREYGQFLPTPGYDDWQESVGLPRSPDFNGAPPDSPFFSDLRYDFKQFALFGEGTWQFFNPKWSLTAGVRYYDFDEDRTLTFAGLFADPAPPRDTPGSTSSNGISPRAILTYAPTEDLTFNAQLARGFRLGGINDPINTGLCTPEDLQIFGGVDNWEDEKIWNYEVGAKSRLAGGTVILNASVFYNDIEDLQAVTVAGTCSSRIIFNVPHARSAGAELELFARPNESWDFGVSVTYAEAELRSTVVSVTPGGPVIVGGLEKGNRLPTAPELQAAASVGYTMPIGSMDGFANLTVQHVGDSYTQIADQVDGFGTFAIRDYGNPTITEFSFDPKLPSYEIGNLRFGVRAEMWEAAVFVNNVWDERAFLSVDTERGRVARVGYLTNQPRTYGVMFRVDF